MKNRATGRSTREIDEAVQDLFMTGMCVIRDHHGTKQADYYTFRRLLGRLEFEHSHIKNNLIVDKSNCTVKIKDFKYED